jgi:UDP-glucose 4-epimerase
MIKLIIFDFDGVFTNSNFYFDNSNNIKKTYNAKDAYSLKIIKKYNIKCGIITNDKIVSIKHAPHIFDRLDKVSLGSNKPKLEILETWLNEYGFSYQDVAYIGDDLPDIPVLKKVGFSACPNDAVDEVKQVSQYICKNKGGNGVVREFVDLIIKKNNNLTNFNNIKDKYKYLITGGYGFLGINFIHYLLNNGISHNDIIIIDNLSTSNSNINNYSFLKNISFIKGDVGNDNFINNLKFKVDVIFHFAAQSGGEGSFDDTIYDSNTNSKGTLLLLNYARRIKCNKFIFTSTCAVYGGLNENKHCYSEDDDIDPNTFYAINKLSSEKYLKLYNKNYGIDYTIFRLFNCYGPYQNLGNMKQGMVSIFLKQILSDEYPEIIVKGNLNRTRDFIYVEDVLKIIFDSVNNSKFKNDLFNLGTGVPNTVKTLLENLQKNSKQKKILIKGNTPGDMGKLYADNSKLQKIYDNKFKFTTLENGIKKFCDHYINNNSGDEIINDGKITAVIPVRKGSERCKNKNTRNFGDTNLLKLKIETLKKVKNIDEIIVSTDCNKMMKTALKLNVNIHKREEYYASSKCPNYEYWNHIAENVGKYTNFMMVNAVSPLIDSSTIQNFIDTFKKNNFKNMVTVNEQKSFFCNSVTREGINFDYKKSPNSQELEPLSEITFGICISTRKDIIENKCIYGKNPLFFNLNSISSVDIDENSDFITAELLYKNNIMNENTCKNILEKRKDKIELLDCTIRDGGYLNNWDFSDEEVIDCYRAATEAGYDYFEIGFRTNKKLLENKGKWCYSNENDINNIFKKYNGCKIVVMAKIGTVTIDDFIKKDKSNINMVRVLLARATKENEFIKSYYNKFDVRKAKLFCQQLIDYGYEVCMNFGCGDIINDDEIKIIASEFHDVKIKALYLADTYGGFNINNVPIQLHKFYNEFNKYKSNMPFGFHCHNNNEDALSKTKAAIYHGCTIIDSCIGGLGRGAGNLKSEQLMAYLCKDKTEYIKRITPLIVYFDKHILSKKEFQQNHHINAHPYYMISSVLSLHPNYITEILSMNTNVINDIKLILNLDKYTKKNNKRNYDKNLIKKICI